MQGIFYPGYFLMSLVISVGFMITFYGYFKIKMTRRQIFWQIISCILWGWTLSVLQQFVDNPTIYALGVCFELSYICGMIALFVDEGFFRSFFCTYLAARLAVLIGSTCMRLIDVRFVTECIGAGDFEHAKLWEIVVYAIIYYFVLILVRPFILKLCKIGGIWEWMYRIVFSIVMALVLIVYIIRMLHPSSENAGIWQSFQYMFGLMMIAASVLLLVQMKRKQMQKLQYRVEAQATTIQNNYEKLIEEEQEYRKLRHEWARQSALLRDAVGYVPSEELKKYVSTLQERTKEHFMIPLSGNLYMDMALEHNYRQLLAQHCVTEIVVEPLELSEQKSQHMMQIIEELFHIAIAECTDKKWCRFSLLKKQQMLVYKLEVSNINQKKGWLLRTFQNMDMQQSVQHVRVLAEQVGGAIDCQTAQNRFEIIGMMPL